MWVTARLGRTIIPHDRAPCQSHGGEGRSSTALPNYPQNRVKKGCDWLAGRISGLRSTSNPPTKWMRRDQNHEILSRNGTVYGTDTAGQRLWSKIVHFCAFSAVEVQKLQRKKGNPRYRRCSAEPPPPPKRCRFMQVYNQVLFCSDSIEKHCECILLIIRSEVGGWQRRRWSRKRGTTFSASARTDNHPNHP